MSWLQKISQKIEFDQTLNVLRKYVEKLPGEWKINHVNRLDAEEMSIGYKGRNVKTHLDEYQVLVWFMYDPVQKPSYDQSIGHHLIRFGCQVFRILDPDDEGRNMKDIGFARQELDTPKDVVDYAWSRIELDGWGGDEQEDDPIDPTDPVSTSPHVEQVQNDSRLVTV